MITLSLIISIGLTLFIAGGAFYLTRGLAQLTQAPNLAQLIALSVVEAMDKAIREVVGDNTEMVLPFIGSLWIFVLLANLIGLIPGLSSPTAQLSVTVALASIVFVSVHWFGIQLSGFSAYCKHYAQPSVILLPFHIISEISRTLALAIRLFGNMMSLEIAAVLVLIVAGLLVPIPLLFLHIVEAVIQAYLFGMLALIYIASGIQLQVARHQKAEGEPQHV